MKLIGTRGGILDLDFFLPIGGTFVTSDPDVRQSSNSDRSCLSDASTGHRSQFSDTFDFSNLNLKFPARTIF